MKNDVLLNALKFYFGHDLFLGNQRQIIENILKKNDTLALLPTGGGKSLLYQLPAVICKGVTLVISPLLAIIKDQIRQLKFHKIPSSYVSSELSVFEQLKELEKAQQNKIKLLYVSPERLNNFNFINTLKYINISLIAVDEAHCISVWGNDFRPSYMNIKNFRLRIQSNPPIIALTATANQQTIEEIGSRLGLKNYIIFKSSFERKNISIQLVKTEDKISYIIYLLKKYIGSKIIYCRSRKETEEIYKILKKNGISCDFFHAGLSTNEKEKKQVTWTKSNFQTLVCTSAFGMGIDKPNVHMVIHFTPSYSLENYYQEIGRTGRNGEKSISYLFWNTKDLSDWYSNIIKSRLNFSEYQKIIRSLYSLYYIANGEKSKQIFSLDIEKLKTITKINNKNKILKVLKFLQNENLIRLNNKNKESKLRLKCLPSEIKYINSIRYQLIELLSRKIIGVFSDEISFSEKDLSQYLGISSEQLKKELQLLKKEQWIEYFDLKSSTIRFTMERNDSYTIDVLWNSLHSYQENEILKFKEFKYFIEQNKYCRTRLILAYFNENKIENCKTCDICLNKQDLRKKYNLLLYQLLYHKIYRLVQEKKRNLQELILEFSSFKEKFVIYIIQDLLNNEKIRLNKFNTYIAL